MFEIYYPKQSKKKNPAIMIKLKKYLFGKCNLLNIWKL